MKSKTNLIYSAIILAFAFLLYGKSLSHNYNFDDEYVVLNEQVQKGITVIPEIFTSRYFTSEDQAYGYRPITKATFAIEVSIFGSNPKISHLINLLLYCISGILLFYFLANFFKEYPKWLWLFIVLLFLSHPLHTEVVNSLKNREEILSFLFGLIGLFFVFRVNSSYQFRNLILAFLFFIFSILSKESGVIFLVSGLILVVFDYTSKRKLIKIPKLKIHKINLKPNLNPKFIIAIGLLYFVFFSFLVFSVHSSIEVIFHIILLIIFVLYFPYLQFFGSKKLTTNNWHFVIYTIFIFSLIFHFEPIGLLGYTLMVFTLLAIELTRFIKINKSEISSALAYSLKSGLILISILGVGFLIFFLSYQVPQEFLNETVLRLGNNQTPLVYNPTDFGEIKLAGEVFVKYISLLIYPEKLLFYYGYNTIPIPQNFNLNSIFLLAFVIFGSVAFLVQSHKKPRFLFTFLLFFGILFFSNLLFEVPGIIGERLMFVASLGFCGLLGLGIYKIFSLKSKLSKAIAIFLGITILILYSQKTISRTSDWQNKDTLYSSDISYLKSSARANMIYADLLFGKAQKKLSNNSIEGTKAMIEAAAYYYETSLNVDSSNFTAFNNLGTIYFGYLEKPLKAKIFLKKAVKMQFANYYAFNNLALIYEGLQKPDSAIMYFEKSIQLKPKNLEGLFGLGRMKQMQLKFDQAFNYYVAVLENYPTEAEAHEKMGDLLLQTNDTSNAIRFYQNVLKIDGSRIDIQQKIERLLP